MKKFLTILAVSFMAAFVLGSCNKSDDPSYPSHLAGYWDVSNGSTGYHGILAITDIAGGQYAALVLFTPAGIPDQQVEGSFTYDATTGQGTIKKSGVVGASTVNIQTLPGTDQLLAISVTTVTSPVTVQNYDGTKMETIAFTTGTWKGEYILPGAPVVNFELKVNSVNPTSGDCGTITASADSTSETGAVTGISQFIQRDNGNCMGLMEVTGFGEGTEPVILPVISTTSDFKTITLFMEVDEHNAIDVTLNKK